MGTGMSPFLTGQWILLLVKVISCIEVYMGTGMSLF